MHSLSPYGLTCEFLESPRGVDEPAPRLAWKLRSGTMGDRQTGYRLTVRAAGEHVWEASGDGGQQVAYEGPPLEPSTRYDWTVEVRDAWGAVAGRAASWFETGLMDGWEAAWIARDDGSLPVFEPPRDDDLTLNTRKLSACSHLRKSFDLDEAPVRARLHASARGLHRFSLNGARVSDGELEPGWTDYRHRIRYQTYDVTAHLSQGPNVLAALLADGWWSGFVGFDPRKAGKLYGDAPQLIAQLVMEFADGARRVIATDGTWRESPGPLRYADLLMGEYFDATKRLDGWDEPGFDDIGWPNALATGTGTGALVWSASAPVRVVADLPAQDTWRTAGGATIADLGQNMVGRVRLTVRGAERGCRIRLRHAEMLEDGGLHLANLRRAEATDVYICAGDPVEVYEPAFTVHGFRYVEITGYDGPIEVTGRVLQSDTPWTGEFSCSDPLVNRLHENIRWGQRGNFVAVPTDCPQRDERLGWLADAQVFLPTAARGADVAAFFADWMPDVLTGQDAQGGFPDVAPKVCLTREGAPGWGDAGVIVPWTLHRLYGDRRLLQRCLPAMAAWVDGIERHNPDLIWRTRTGRNYGDWLQVGADTPREVLATAYFAQSATLVAEACRVLGEPHERYEKLAAAIRQAFDDAFVDAEGRIRGDTQTCYLLALEFGLTDPERAAAHLVRDLAAHNGHLTTGFLGVALLCPVLTRVGRADLAYRLLHQETFPSWLFSVKHGATTIWERWDGWTPEHGFQSAAMNSFNHYSLGAVGDWLYGGVAGIGQAAGSSGYAGLVVSPHPGGKLTWARAVQETARGRVESAWSLTGGVLTLEVLVPPGAAATVHVPTRDRGAIEPSAHVTVLERRDGVVVCSVASGRHRFTTPWLTHERTTP
ncbi:family 78 glycoside hydrolase catalytic domain [Nonomuraea sp. 3N208]|uniref:family 78 glycoside hydrolase catalytic domain n=1 Tax=Nonomuraea sp. 3N208 TaxID=3457421 RepID=UPI003FD55500